MGTQNSNVKIESPNDNTGEYAEHHVTPFNVYIKVAVALFALTFLTVGAHAIGEHLQPFTTIIAFTIAAVKAALVVLFFMHLKYETKINRVVFASGFIFLMLLFVICALDFYTRVFQASVL